MSAAELLLSLAGGTIVLLLSVIAYFLKLLIQDSRQMNTELSRMKESFIRLEAEQILMKTILQRNTKSTSRNRTLKWD
ncbi:hypothetical protein [Algoriphagus aquimarinus]|uniref:Uncharacterized protein n=1 Tax=Algoriphagus aquimarinus TaxID=237018 RepID=A0A5C7AZX2_9BACT|nr:hypothetical protein [Algoriphagus aquimarinus]TXE13744.1 hypothetical protein ESV85_07205 [Algoriphagus aquimarinus]